MKLKNGEKKLNKKNLKYEPKKYTFKQFEAIRSLSENICTRKARTVEAEEDQSNLLKALRQTIHISDQEFQHPTFYRKLYVHFLRSCCENIFKFECIVSDKVQKYISQFALLFLASIRSCLQFHRN